MAYGLQVFNASGVLTFDSATVIGAVCLGRYTVPLGGTTFTFPAFPGGQGRFIFATGGADNSYSIDSALGYPRFTFGAAVAGYDVLLFVF